VIHYSNPLQNRYYCKLEGVDPNWKYIGNTGRVQYASLSPGRYVFKARGATSDGIMNEQGDEVVIIIHPPFWEAWWFYFMCGCVFLGLTYSWYRYRLNEALKTEKLRNKISADLHDEIGSTLSSISIMSDMVAQKTTENRTSEVASEIRENAIVLMERMDDIVWSINPRNDSLENLLLRVKRFAGQLFEAKNIDYEIDINPDVEQVKMPMEVRQSIYLILKEAINNLVKHSKATKASIEVTQANSTLMVTIRDNGVGFNARGLSLGNGITSMKNRASDVKVKLSIDSEKGKGTVVKLNLKIK
jgi:signal transduction histidine kinase